MTPSYIDNLNRMQFAVRSLESLRYSVGEKYDHIVVDDIPRLSLPISRTKSIQTPAPKLSLREAGKKVYDEPNVKLIRRYKSSNVTAMIRAIEVANQRGADLVFLHMDDNIYLPVMSKLIKYAIDAFEQEDNLKHVHLSGWPMISDQCSEKEGNKSLIDINSNSVDVDGIKFTRSVNSEYTLWSSPFSMPMSRGDLWPIVAWSSIFRVGFLKWLLKRDPITDLPGMGEFEAHYRKEQNWNEVVDRGGELGYINMQFGGFEMHRNKNWRELISYPNEPVR